jgi:hypothetical protein
MNHIDFRKRIAQISAVVLLAFGSFAQADESAVCGMDPECSVVQPADDLSEAESHLLSLKGTEMAAELRVAQAERHQRDVTVELKNAEANLKVARKAVGDAETANHR